MCSSLIPQYSIFRIYILIEPKIGPMDPKDLSPAYLTSLISMLIGALLVGASASTLLFVVGWVLLLAGLGLNIFSTLIMVQRSKGGPLPALLVGESSRSVTEDEAESGNIPVDDMEPVTESHQIIPSDAAATSDERIFRPRPPHVR